MRALLRSPDPPPPRGEFATQSSAAAEGGLDAASWKEKVADAKQALDARNPDLATARYTELYQDLAKTAGANSAAPPSTDDKLTSLDTLRHEMAHLTTYLVRDDNFPDMDYLP